MMSALVSRLGSGGGGPAPAGQAKPSAATRRRAEKWAQGLTTRDATAATDTMADVQAALLDAQATSYARCPDVVTVIEATLIAALGNLHASVREAAVVLLNVLYDGHAMQLENALTPAVSSVGEAPVVRLSLPQTDPTQPTVLPKGSLTLRLFGPVDAGRPPRWTTHDVTSTAGGGSACGCPRFPGLATMTGSSRTRRTGTLCPTRTGARRQTRRWQARARRRRQLGMARPAPPPAVTPPTRVPTR